MNIAAMDRSTPPRTFLHMDPDSGMTMVMLHEEDGFRPMTAAEEVMMVDLGLNLVANHDQIMAPEDFDGNEGIDEFVAQHERAYGMSL